MNRPSLLTIFRWLVWRDFMLAWRRRADLLSTLFFFVLVVSLFPLGIGPQTELLRAVAPGIIWAAALLASTLALGRLFAADYADGSLDQLLLAPQPLYLTVLGKVLSQCLVSALPLILTAPLIGMQFGLASSATVTMTASLALGVPVLCLLGSIGAALTLGTRSAGFLIALLMLPLFVPVLIFGAAATASSGAANLSLLAAMLILAVIFAPLATSAALRIAVE